jgi:hypothetical protein
MSAEIAQIEEQSWLTAWDEKMIAILDPMAAHEKPPHLQLFFFANTFPLAYHYAIALSRHGRTSPQEHIQLGEWEKSEPDVDPVNGMRYTIKPITSNGITPVPVTVFQPRWAFVPFTLGTSRIWNSVRSVPTDAKEKLPPVKPLLDFLKAAKSEGFDHLWIYAELEVLGRYLQSLTGSTRFASTKLFHTQVVDGRCALPCIQRPSSHQNVLRMFIYGGSLSSYLLCKTTRYLALKLPDEEAQNGSMATYISCPSKWQTVLKAYHSALYESAVNFPRESSTCLPFFTVYRGYNEMAWLLQHRSSFKDSDDFARCLRHHHMAIEG